MSCGLYGLLHSFLASHTIKRWIERHFGDLAQRFYRLFFGLTAGLTALLLVGGVGLLLPDLPLYSLPSPWRYAALLVQALAAIALLAAVLQTGAASFLGLSQIVRPEPLNPLLGPEQLVTNGFYRWVRHPLYSFSFVLLWLTPVMTWKTLGLAVGLSAYLVIGTIFEERKLVAEFGAAYEEYRRKTPAFFPRLFQ